MSERFEAIWRLYRHGKTRAPLAGDGEWGQSPSLDGALEGGQSPLYPFDGDVKVGDIRIFADANRPFIALLIEDRGLLGYRAVPVSPFPEAASDREVAVGGRIFQAWNATSLARRFAYRSWLVDSLGKAGLEVVRAAVGRASPGRLASGDGAAANYEREFLVSGGTFVPPLGRPVQKTGIFHIEWPKVGRLVASTAICLGVFYLLLGPARERIGVWREKAYEIGAMEGIEALELADAESAEKQRTEDDCIEEISVLDDYSPEKLIGRMQIAGDGVLRCAGGMEVQEPPDVGTLTLADRKRKVASVHFLPIRRPDEGTFENPYVRPLSVLETGPFRSFASVAPGEDSAAFAKSAAAAPIAFSNVVVRTVECPWNPEALLLNVKATAVADGLVEVFFDKTLVRAYRVVGGGGVRPVDAWYEFLPVAGAEPGSEFCRVTVRSPGEHGDRRRIVRILKAKPSDFDKIPSPKRRTSRQADFADPKDVGVDVKLE